MGVHCYHALLHDGIPTVFCFNDLWPIDFLPASAPGASREKFRAIFDRGPGKTRIWPKEPLKHVILISDYLRKEFTDAGLKMRKPRTVHQGVDMTSFREKRSAVQLKELKLLSCGRLHPTKGIEFAIETLSEIIKTGGKARLSIIGKGERDYVRGLQIYAEELGVEKKIDWVGALPRRRLAEHYRKHDIFLFAPNWNEPMGLTYLEAMACGTLVIARPTGGAKEVLIHHENCMIAEEPKQAAEQSLLLKSSELIRKKLEQGARKTLKERASLLNYTRAVEEELFIACFGEIPVSAATSAGGSKVDSAYPQHQMKSSEHPTPKVSHEPQVQLKTGSEK
jgi:glycosyltransferase involved in cell wall biosynthesis